jgi:hypothetical protein
MVAQDPGDPEHILSLSWSDNSTDENGFHIERSLDGVVFSQIDTVAADVVSYDDTTLTGETLYYYRVCAFGKAGSSLHSGIQSRRTGTKAPTGLSVLTNTASSITLTWNDNSTTRTEYRIDHYHDTDPWAQIDVITGAPFDEYFDGGLPAGTHHYRILAAGPDGESAYSNEIVQTLP